MNRSEHQTAVPRYEPTEYMSQETCDAIYYIDCQLAKAKREKVPWRATRQMRADRDKIFRLITQRVMCERKFSIPVSPDIAEELRKQGWEGSNNE